MADFVARHWLLILLVWVAVPVLVQWAAPSWDQVAHDGDFAYLLLRMTSVRGQEFIHRAFPENEDKSDVALILGSPQRTCSRRLYYAVAEQLAEEFAPPSPPSAGKKEFLPG